jgi:hypothetical protein
VSSIIFFFAIGTVLLIVMSKIPGLEHTVKPIVGIIIDSLWEGCKFLALFGLVLAKRIVGAHFDLFRHLVSSEESLDPTAKMRESAEQ